MFVDQLMVFAGAGKGGDGVTRWRHEKFVPNAGPAGGNGGKGGDVYVESVSDLGLLAKYTGNPVFEAPAGEAGHESSKHGKGGNDLTIKVPVGSIVTDVARARVYEFFTPGHRERIFKGGNGGLGNEHFKSATNRAPEDPGSLKIFNYKDGVLTKGVSIAPNGGYGFGPRHLDFHPTQPWVYVSLERQNKMYVYRMEGDALSSEAIYKKETLANPDKVISRQAAGTVHVHPNGRFLYGVNRADTTRELEGRNVFMGGENTLAVYSINPSTGEPTPIQQIDTRGIHCRTFHIDPSGRMLVAAHNVPVLARDGAGVNTVPACLSVFRISPDGTLGFVRKYDVDTRDKIMFWMGMVPL